METNKIETKKHQEFVFLIGYDRNNIESIRLIMLGAVRLLHKRGVIGIDNSVLLIHDGVEGFNSDPNSKETDFAIICVDFDDDKLFVQMCKDNGYSKYNKIICPSECRPN